MDNQERSLYQRRKDCVARFAKLPDKEKKVILTITLSWLLNILVDRLDRAEKEPNLEQIPHANQDAIDAVFYEIMADEEDD